jgi:dUTP pyrophosphatase
MDKVPLSVSANEDVDLPFYASVGASGADIKAKILSDIVIEPGESKIIPTGLRFEIPHGYEIQVRPRSGLAVKNQVTVLNTPGTIDADYRGELLIIMINHGKEPFVVTNGMRIAQIVLAQVAQAVFTRQDVLETTTRGEGKFGSTGTH